MYSRNDYRYYLESRLAESDDFLAHYGVKGMKWKNHKKAVQDKLAAYREKHGIKNSIFNKEMWKRDPDFNKDGFKVTHEVSVQGNSSTNVKSEQAKGKRRTAREKVKVQQERGRARTDAIKSKSSSEYQQERSSNVRKNVLQQKTKSRRKADHSTPSTPRKKSIGQKLNDRFKPKNGTFETVSFRDQRTGKEYVKKRR